jgi:hypothetical protein
MFSNLFWRRFTDKETEDAIATGRHVRLFTGKPTGRYDWSVGINPFAPRGGWRPERRERQR